MQSISLTNCTGPSHQAPARKRVSSPPLETALKTFASNTAPEQLAEPLDSFSLSASTGTPGHGGFLKAGCQPGVEISDKIILPAVLKKALVPFSATVPEGIQQLASSRVLVIDNQKAVCRVLAKALGRLGCEVSQTHDGGAALLLYSLALIEDRRFDIVITDLIMPLGINGLELMRGLSAIDPQVKVIISSGNAIDPAMIFHREHGFRGVLPKPYDLATLERVVMAALLPISPILENNSIQPLPLSIETPALTTEWTAFPKAHALQA